MLIPVQIRKGRIDMRDLIAKQNFTDEELKTFKNNSSWSCDTFVIMPDVSEEEATILSKKIVIELSMMRNH